MLVDVANPLDFSAGMPPFNARDYAGPTSLGEKIQAACRDTHVVKDLHPDMNGGDRSDEDRLQEVVWAWDQIKDSRYFRE